MVMPCVLFDARRLVCLAEGSVEPGTNCVHVLHYAPVNSEKASLMRRLQLFSTPLSPRHRALIFAQSARASGGASSRKTSAPARPLGLQQLSVAANERLASSTSTNNVNLVSDWIAELPGELSSRTTSTGETLGVENDAFTSASPSPAGLDCARQTTDGPSNPMGQKRSNARRLGAPAVTIHPPTPSAERAPPLELAVPVPVPAPVPVPVPVSVPAHNKTASSPTAVNSPASEKDSEQRPKLAEAEVITPDSGDQSPTSDS